MKYEQTKYFRTQPQKCIECGKPAVFEHVTQFCGEHPYCENCAKKEKDFGRDDSYGFWRSVA